MCNLSRLVNIHQSKLSANLPQDIDGLDTYVIEIVNYQYIISTLNDYFSLGWWAHRWFLLPLSRLYLRHTVGGETKELQDNTLSLLPINRFFALFSRVTCYRALSNSYGIRATGTSCTKINRDSLIQDEIIGFFMYFNHIYFTIIINTIVTYLINNLLSSYLVISRIYGELLN